MLYCPVCGKGFTCLVYLKKHFQTHRFSCCPICGAEVKKIIRHAYRMYRAYDCKGHAILWILLTNKTRCSLKNKLAFERAKEITIEELSEGFSFASYKPPIPKQNSEYRKNKQYTCWTYEEVEFLVKNYGKMSVREIAIRLGRSENAVRAKIKRIHRNGRRGLKPKYIVVEGGRR